MVDSALVAQRDRELARTAFALPHQEAAVDEAAEQILGCAARHRSMIPAVLLQTVHRRDVVTGNPALTVFRANLTPFTILVVAQHPELLS